MSSKMDIYSKEATLINRSKRELVDGREKNPIEKLRLLCFARGATGILGLARAFHNLDTDGSKTIKFEEFCKGVKEADLKCSEEDLKEMYDSFDADKTGSLEFNEFLEKLRPPMSAQRLSLITKAFDKMDKNNDGAITLENFKGVYNVKDNPKYLSGDFTENEILANFLKNFEESKGNNDGKVTKEEFINYYSTISASIDHDAYFDLMMRRAYKL